MEAAVGVVLFMLFAGFLVGLAIVSHRRGTKYLRIAHAERTRRAWLVSGTQLFELAQRKKIRVRSKTFELLCNAHQYIAEHPTDSRRVATYLKQTVFSNPNVLTAERPNWPTDLFKVLGSMGYAMRMASIRQPVLEQGFRVNRIHVLQIPLKRLSRLLIRVHVLVFGNIYDRRLLQWGQQFQRVSEHPETRKTFKLDDRYLRPTPTHGVLAFFSHHGRHEP